MIDPHALMALLARNRPGGIPNVSPFGAGRFPTPTARVPTPTKRAPTPGFDPAAGVKGEGMSRALSSLFGLDPRSQAPGVSNNPALRAGLQQAGLALLASPRQPGTFTQNVANAIGYGQQVAQGTDAQHSQAQARKAMLDGLPPEMRRWAELLSPEDFSKLVMERAKPRDRYGSAGSRIFNKDTGEVSSEAPVSENERYQAFSNGGVWDKDGARWLIDPPPPTPVASINVGPQEGAIEKSFADAYVSAQDAARSARARLSRLDQLEEALSDPNLYQGFGAEAILKAKKAGSFLGIEFDGIGSGEVAQAISNEIALQLRNPAGGAGMPGALSDKDREFLQTIPPGIGKTPEGNAFLIEVARRVAERDIEVGRLAREYRRDHGKVDDGFYDLLDAHFGDRDTFMGLVAPPTTPGGATPVPGGVRGLRRGGG